MHKHTDPGSAAAELLKRRQIRNSLTGWARYKEFEPAPHHQLFIREIEGFLKSDDEVLLLFAPPGSAKSTYVSVLLPSWYLAANPTHSILAATHNFEFAERWGRRVRNDIAADSQVLGISLSEDSKAAARWSLTAGGEYYGVGAGVATIACTARSTSISARRAFIFSRIKATSINIADLPNEILLLEPETALVGRCRARLFESSSE